MHHLWGTHLLACPRPSCLLHVSFFVTNSVRLCLCRRARSCGAISNGPLSNSLILRLHFYSSPPFALPSALCGESLLFSPSLRHASTPHALTSLSSAAHATVVHLPHLSLAILPVLLSLAFRAAVSLPRHSSALSPPLLTFTLWPAFHSFALTHQAATPSSSVFHVITLFTHVSFSVTILYQTFCPLPPPSPLCFYGPYYVRSVHRPLSGNHSSCLSCQSSPRFRHSPRRQLCA